MTSLLSIALIVPYASESGGFFDDTLLGALCSVARGAGHRAELAHVYYQSQCGETVGNTAAHVEDWLISMAAHLVVIERLFDPTPLVSFRSRRPTSRVLLVSRGDPFDDLAGVDFVLGVPGRVCGSGTRRTPTTADIVTGFSALLDSLAHGEETATAPELYRVADNSLVSTSRQSRRSSLSTELNQLSLNPELGQVDIIDSCTAPKMVRKTLLGNSGCPYARDALASPEMHGVTLPDDVPVSRLGCTFCFMGGDYQKRPRDIVVSELVEQALWITTHAPTVTELVLADQHPLPYLAKGIQRAHSAGIRPIRWLFSTRGDTFLRQRRLVGEAIEAAKCAGHQIEVHLIGFEAFCERELARYNKGVTVHDLLCVVEAVRTLATMHPGTFHYAQARAHSLILWNPWTSPEDLSESVAAIRHHGLAELFSDLGSNRVRLYPDVPLTYAAARDGALTQEWESEVPSRGYAPGKPWKFLDGRTRFAFSLSRQLKERLGQETEVAQLAATCDLAVRLATRGADFVGTERSVMCELDTLAATLAELDSERGADAPPRGCDLLATPVVFTGACNNGCAHCSNGDAWLPDDTPALRARVQTAQGLRSAILFAGREPSLHPAFLELIAQASNNGNNLVGTVTNGRRFAYERFARAAARHLVGVSVKLHGTRPSITDKIVKVDGAHDQSVAGARALAASGVVVEVRAPLLRHNLHVFADYLDVARACGARQIRIEASLDGIRLDALGHATNAVIALAKRCASEGFPVEASPLVTACNRFDRLPIASGQRNAWAESGPNCNGKLGLRNP